MEALLLFLDVGVLIAVFVWAIRHDGRVGPTTGLFRFNDRVSTKSLQTQQAVARPRASR